MNDQDQDAETLERPESYRPEYLAGIDVLIELQVSAGPPRPDLGHVCYDPDTEAGQAQLRVYQDRSRQACRDADAKWELRYPGRTFRRLWTPEREAQWVAGSEWQHRAAQVMTESEKESRDEQAHCLESPEQEHW